ncbi:hypothetical protein CBR_g35050 [Chara braunii]|uniref:DNA ligase ATP-dependent N-terminal domain-containing protein n=1 Tax=Chara braunii TaxID=69332 RepID=A0A388LKC1_CHABU|nr:hypothetical protein CBR_g35050 [Chara braunii]|eukprot:GBG82685.1 hypothetical protein CBR_g35050 [Chara braunii]
MLFDSIERNSKPGMKRKMLRKFLNEYYQGRDYYPAMRLILPALDKERNSYGMKQQMLAKCLVDALGVAKDSPDALKLVGWRDGGKKNGKNTGNFVLVAVEVLTRRQSETSFGLTLEDANHLLDRLAAAEKQENIMVMREMINKTSWKEMKWMLSIILKDLHLGLGEKAVFADFHPDAEHLYNMTMDLKGVCEKLHDRSKRLERQDLTIGAVARPQLASRIPNVEQAWKKVRE